MSASRARKAERTSGYSARSDAKMLQRCCAAPRCRAPSHRPIASRHRECGLQAVGGVEAEQALDVARDCLLAEMPPAASRRARNVVSIADDTSPALAQGH